MAKPKDPKNNDDVLELLDSLEKETTTSSNAKGKKKGTAGAGVGATTGSNATKKSAGRKDEEDIMGFLDSLTKKEAASGRSTPSKFNTGGTAAVDLTTDHEEDTPRTSSEVGSRDIQESNTDVKGEPGSVLQEKDEGEPETQSSSNANANANDPFTSITSWWSRNKDGIWDSATSAVKQAEAKVRELQPEVQNSSKSIEHLVSERFSKLGLSRSVLQSTISSVLETLAPPISLHEQLKIHVFHDMVGYPSIDSIVYSVFDRVMQQVEGGGDLTMVIQKGKERHKRDSEHDPNRQLGVFVGSLDQGLKLAKANIEEYVKATGKEAEERKQADAAKSTDGEGPIYRVSDIFLSIQPARLATAEPTTEKSDTSFIASSHESSFYFIIYLYDPINDINFSTVSQAFPSQWAEWLESPDSRFEGFDADPREWVIDWIEEGLGLSVGIVAQSYVAKRMGVDTMYAVNQATQ